jgi:predicted Zn finger-like uncharacterized protein
MRVSCPYCNTTYNVDSAKIPPGGANLKCAKCKNAFPVKPQAAAPAVPLPGTSGATGPAVPLPGTSGATGPAVPLPGTSGATEPAVPLPGTSGATGPAVPLPGTRGASPPVPLPGALGASLAPAVPLPGTSPTPPALAVPKPAATLPPSKWTEAVPLPGTAAAPPGLSQEPDPFADLLPGGAQGEPTSIAPAPAEPAGPSQVEPTASAADPFADLDFGTAPRPPQTAAPAGHAGGFGDVPSEVPEADFEAADPSAVSPAHGDFTQVDAGQAVSPLAPSAPLGPDPFADFGAPAPAVVADPIPFGGEEFGATAPPATAEETGAAPPPRKPVPPTLSPVAPSARARADSREFDPGSAVRKDALEADLSPAPRASAPLQDSAEGELELLDFIDDAGAAGKKVRPSSQRVQIRRKSGKVFGPFDQPTVVKMLSEGQLLGNEDVTSDGEQWAPIGSVPAFGEAIQRLMESPGSLHGASPLSAELDHGAAEPSSADVLERMRALYGNRMASIAVVDGASSQRKFLSLIPYAVGAALALAVLGTGVYLGQTPYGYFGFRWLFPSHLKQGSADYQKYVEATHALSADTFESYTQALSDAKALLAENSTAVESRSLYAQSVFYLKRRFFAGNPELAQARRYLDELELAAKDAPETVKARAGHALLTGQAAQVRPALEAALAKHAQDLELLLLLSESYSQERATGPAIEPLKKALKLEPKSAKALHALGVVRTLEKSPGWPAALELFQQALEAEPRHLSSAVEIAAILIHRLDKPEAAVSTLTRALGEEGKVLLAPNELARAHYLMGMVQSTRHQADAARKEFETALQVFPESAPARAAYGRFLLTRHEYEKALGLFEAAYKSDPKEVDYLDGLVRAMLGSSKLHTASKLIAEAPSELRGSPRLEFLLGRVADEAEKGDEAEKHYRRAAALDASYWEPSFYLGNFFLGRKRLAEAKQAFADALKKAPGVPETHVGQGDWLLAQGKVDDAKKEYLAALAIDREAPAAHFGMAQVLAAEGALDEAKQEFERTVALDPTLPQLFTRQGALLMKRSEWEAAAAVLEKAKNADAKDSTAIWQLGAVELERGRLTEAMRNLDLALGLDPSSAEAHFFKARVHSTRHENTQAVEAMKAALERGGARPDYHYWMGNILLQNNRFDEAVDQWQQAVQQKPDYTDALEALGRGYQERQAFDQAIRFYERVLKMDPARSRLLLSVADCRVGMNRYDEAIAKYKEALKADPTLVVAYFKIGRCFTEKSKLNEAIDWYQKAASSDPDAKEVWRFLGYAYKEKGRRNEAVAAFEKYLELNKDAGDVKDISNEIYDLKSEK